MMLGISFAKKRENVFNTVQSSYTVETSHDENNLQFFFSNANLVSQFQDFFEIRRIRVDHNGVCITIYNIQIHSLNKIFGF